MLSMSSGFILEIPSPPATPPFSVSGVLASLLIGEPSTTYKGWLFPEIDLLPLSTTLVGEPTPLFDLIISIPATFPDSALATLSSLA